MPSPVMVYDIVVEARETSLTSHSMSLSPFEAAVSESLAGTPLNQMLKSSLHYLMQFCPFVLPTIEGKNPIVRK